MPRDLDFAHPLVETPIELEPVFSLRGLIAWLETQPPENEYEYQDVEGCAIARFLRALGMTRPIVGNITWSYVRPDGQYIQEYMPHGFDLHISAPVPHTYGAALTRARVALSGLRG